ncbi:hypothetical protein [Actinomadura sp. NPDC049753]|uniref:hypothetical protein n=1 Tax=Actinomadura sp. NPDC049753 TaxID=3154739 RepID=UPI00343DF142
MGTHSQSDLYRLETLTGSASKVGAYSYHFIWNLAASPDGKVFLAISEPGRVVDYDPARDATSGPASTSPARTRAGSRPTARSW